MNIEDRLEQSKSYKNFRTGLDIGMGTLYTVIGIFIMYAKYTGIVDLPDTWAYVLASLMVLYGLFRVYRGLVVVMPKRRDARSVRQQ